jgi:hypothetical protein
VLIGPTEQLGGAMRALEITVGVVFPGDADRPVHLDHLGRRPGQRVRAVRLRRRGEQREPGRVPG